MFQKRLSMSNVVVAVRIEAIRGERIDLVVEKMIKI
jgi:hypothetical protein